MDDDEIRNKMKQLSDKYGVAQLAVWLNIRDGRTVSVWIGRGPPRYRRDDIIKVLKRRCK